jgi:pimeloyl-ACP methyl ester carboxylesterase
MLTLDQRFAFQGQSVAWGSIGDGTPVILIHGFPWSAQAWRNIAPWIAKTYKVYFFDMLGCGLSEKYENQTVSENVQSDLLEALVEHWQLHKPPEFDVHLVWGEHDTFIPLEQGRELQGLLAADSFTVIKNAAHIVHEDAPEAIVGALLRNL